MRDVSCLRELPVLLKPPETTSNRGSQRTILRLANGGFDFVKRHIVDCIAQGVHGGRLAGETSYRVVNVVVGAWAVVAETW